MITITSRPIWDLSRIPDREQTRMELTCLTRFKDHWYCGFREGESHWNHPSGRGRIIRSADGVHWESVLLLEWDGGDVREPKLSVTPEGRLLINTSVYFVSREPRNVSPPSEHGMEAPPEAASRPSHPQYYQLEKIGTVLNMPPSDREELATQQSVNWLTSDGLHWESATACPSGLNTWRWDVTWHDGMGYSLGQWGKDLTGTLYRTRDGKHWHTLKADFCPGGKCNEGGFAFGPDGTGYCLLRHGSSRVMLGIGKSPYFVEWTWHEMEIDWMGDGQTSPAADVLRTSLGGPQLRCLPDGRLLAAGRALGPGQDDGRIALFWLNTKTSVLTRFAEIDGTSYPGLHVQGDHVWVTSASPDIAQILLAQVPLGPIG